MTQENKALLYLVRLAVGGKLEPVDCLYGIDWKSVVEASYTQALPAIAVDGLQRLYDTVPDLALALDSPELEGLKYEWFGSTFQAETEYARHQGVFSALVGLLVENNINVLLLKGLGLSHYYPVPNHRPTGDIDIYSYGHHLGIDDIAGEYNIIVNNSHPKESVFEFKGIMIENHYLYLDSFLSRCESKVQAFLETLDEDVLCEGGYYTPSPLKNYFFLLCHMARHFSEFESIRLRHILDWGLFLKAESDGLDMQLVRGKLQEFGLEKTNDLFVSLAERVCGLDLSDLLFERLPEDECNAVLDYILTDKQRVIPKQFVPRFLYKLKTLASNNWKFRYLAITMRERVWYSVKHHLNGKAEI